MPPGFRGRVANAIGLAPGNFRVRTLHNELVQVSRVAFGQRRVLLRKFARIAERVVMVNCLQMIFKRLAADSDALLNHNRSLNPRESVAFNCVRRVGEFNIIVMLKRSKRLARQGPQLVQPLLLRGD